MNENFNELPWHDSVLGSIFIDRNNPGENDSIRIEVEWPDGKHSSIIFSDCYAINANMNFGIVASETILTAECIDAADDIESIYKKWLQVGIRLENLKCFKINTNSTNSVIEIFSLGFKIYDN